jgi:hypothetical protein
LCSIFTGPNTSIHPVHIILLKPLLHFLIDLLVLGSGGLVLDNDHTVLSRQDDFAMLGDFDVGNRTVHF